MKEKRSLFKLFFGNKNGNLPRDVRTFLQMLSGYNPTYTTINGDIYESKIARQCIDRIATNCAKFVPKHYRKGQHVLGDINRLLEFEPNPLMSKFDFIYKIISQLYTDSNAFVYIAKDSEGFITGFFPILALNYNLYQDSGKNIYLQFQFVNGQTYTLPYNELIHLRLFYNKNDIFGESNDVLKTDLQAVQTASEGIKNAIQLSNNLKGILKFTNAMLKNEDIKKNKEQFVNDFINLENSSGIVALDSKADFQTIDMKPITLDKEQLKQVNSNIFDYFGISEKIINNDFTEDEWNAFYEGVLEPRAIQLGDEFTRKIFSKEAIRQGNRINFTANRMQYASLNTKTKLIHELAPYGMLRVDEGREIIDLPPLGGDEGNRILQSLNTIDTSIANDYQGGE